MTDLSKVDWTKCKLEPLPCLMENGEADQIEVIASWNKFHRNVILGLDQNFACMIRTGHGSIGWIFIGGTPMSTDQILVLIDRAKEVNAFIESLENP